MKIFAKRKRTNTVEGSTGESTSGTSLPPPNRTSFASDPVVAELLKKDPKEWNSKERRMIKRHQERNVGNDQDTSTTTVNEVTTERVPENDLSQKPNENSLEDETKKNKSDDDEKPDDDHDSDDTSDSEEGDEETKEATSLAVPSNEGNIVKPDTSSAKSDAEHTTEKRGNSDSEIDPNHEVYSILEKLNSKTKRTLTRKLDRGGLNVLAEVLDEAKKALDGGGPSTIPVIDDKKNVTGDSSNTGSGGDKEETPSKKKRKKEVDLSSLSAEERLRREDQRRKQQEAAERRLRGEDKTPGYKHPLNSERRRANKRKPKWTSTSGSTTTTNSTPSNKGIKNEHNHSGYLHRKRT